MIRFRHAMFLVVGVTAVVALAGCAGKPQPETAPAAADGPVVQRTYEVFGMDCPGCHGGVEKLVEAVPGVLDAQASWQGKKIDVTVGEGAEVSDEAIRDAIARANFTAGERTK